MSTATRLRRAPAIAGACFVLGLESLLAQAPPPPPPPPPSIAPGAVVPNSRRHVSGGQVTLTPGQLGAASNQISILRQNYLVKLVVKNGEAEESVEVLTASPILSFNCVLGKSPFTLVTFTGTLQESEDGSLVLQYSVGGRVPQVTESAGTQPGQAVRIEYNDETSSGAIHVTPGTPQTLLKSGARRYSLVIAPAEKSE
jgi:hypothetical protein